MEIVQRLYLSLSQMDLHIVLKSQVISLNKMVVLSTKFTILILWPPICISLILLLALVKLTRTSAAIMYKSRENRHPWQTSRVRVKESDRRPFKLILDWILVSTSLTMSMNLSPYPNLCKVEKLKSQSILRILQKYFYSVYLTHQLCNKQKKVVKVFYFQQLLFFNYYFI